MTSPQGTGTHTSPFAPAPREIVLSIAACVVALALGLGRALVPADLAMLVVLIAFTAAWAVLVDPVFSRWFAKDGDGEDTTNRQSGDERSSSIAFYKRWLLGIAAPVIATLVVSIAYPVEELVGPGARVPEPLLPLLVFSVTAWILGLIAWLFLVAPARLILSGLRSDGRHRGGGIFWGVEIYLLVIACVAAASGARTPTFGSPGWAGESLRILVGLDSDAVTSPAWMFTARLCFILAIVVLPLTAWCVHVLSTRRSGR